MLDLDLIPKNCPLLVAITGNIGSGKSSVLELFNSHQPTISCDVINRNLIAEDLECQKLIVDCFQNSILINGKISTNELKNIIFQNPEARKKLESIMHPLIFTKIVDWIKLNLKAPYLAIEVPVLIESGWSHIFDKIVVVRSDKEFQLDRVKKRDNKSQEMIAQILKLQANEKEQNKIADYLIKNNNDFNYLREQVNKINGDLISLVKN